MSIEVVCLGKTKQGFVAEGIEEYAKRIRVWRPLRIVEQKDVSLNVAGSVEEVKHREAAILGRWLEGAHTVLLDERGEEPDSPAFAELLRAHPQLRFIIGGVYGTDDSIRTGAAQVISLSRLTFTHQLARLVLVEQLYRGLSILHGKAYHY